MLAVWSCGCDAAKGAKGCTALGIVIIMMMMRGNRTASVRVDTEEIPR